MAAKRKYQAFLSGSSEARIDPHYGQHHAFPGLEDDDIDNSGSEDSESSRLDQGYVDYLNAMSYLKDVRAEAQRVPMILKAQQDSGTETLSKTDNALNHVKSYYADGAYFSVPNAGSELEDSMSRQQEHNNAEGIDYTAATSTTGRVFTVEAQDAYHHALLTRFQTTRSSYSLLGSPTPQALSSLDPKTQPVSVNHQQPAKIESAKWSYILQNETPTPAQLLAMPQESILWLLERIPSMIKRKKWLVDGGRQGQAMGLWIWSLLLRLDEPGTLNYEEIGIIRELGKRAAGIVSGLDSHHEQDWEVKEDEDEPDDAVSVIDQQNGFEDTENAEPLSEAQSEVEVTGLLTAADMEAARQRILSKIGSTTVDESDIQNPAEESFPSTAVETPLKNEEICIATLDMILTITGEYYGQRDLLAARNRLWVRN